MSKHTRTRNVHACPNCGAEISNAYEFCARNVFGNVVEDRCRAEYEAFWRRPQDAKPAIKTPTYGFMF